jgi:hypothetical protein
VTPEPSVATLSSDGDEPARELGTVDLHLIVHARGRFMGYYRRTALLTVMAFAGFATAQVAVAAHASTAPLSDARVVAHALYVTDSSSGTVWKVSLGSGTASVWAQGADLEPSTVNSSGFGANGIKVHWRAGRTSPTSIRICCSRSADEARRRRVGASPPGRS